MQRTHAGPTRTALRFVPIVVAVVVGATGPAGPTELGAQTLSGRVVDEATRDGVAGAVITLADRTGTVVLTVMSDDTGAFSLTEPDPPGRSYTLRVERLGYSQAAGQVRFDATRAVDVDVYLAPDAVDVDPVVVSGTPEGYLADVGFDTRRTQGRGIFISREDLEARAVSRITDALRGQAGLRVVSVGTTDEDIRIGRAGGRLSATDCQPAIWIDGSKIRGAGEPEVHQVSSGSTISVDRALTELIAPEDIAGLEVYAGPGGLPVQFHGRNVDCGVVLIWTRRR